MAAPIGNLARFHIRALFFHSRKASERLTYCRKAFYCRSMKEQSTVVTSHIVTKESKVDEPVAEFLEQFCVGSSGHVNYKRHPGAMRKIAIKLPARLIKSVKVLLDRYPVEALTTKTQKLVRYLQARQPPLSNKELAIKTKEVEQKILEKDGDKLSSLEGGELELAKKEHEKKVLAKLRSVVYHWHPMQFDAFTSYIYLMGRVASDFSVHMQCFVEISKRDPEFKPSSVYYFGSKVGSGIWASDRVWKGIGEHYCVDSSGFMNTISRLLLQDGNEQSAVMTIKGVYFRQFAPSPKQNHFSLVVCPYMLMEQASDKERLQLVLDLWEMTENYLVLIENGTTAGFSLIDEARDFLLSLSQEDSTSPLEGHVFAPCPHDSECPKKRDKKQPCLTECVSNIVDFAASKATDRKNPVRYSYVILKKGPRESNTEWPRVLQHSKALRHNHCHLCLPCGQLQHLVITKGKFEKHLYGCSKYLDQGDRLPVGLLQAVPEQSRNDDDSDNVIVSSTVEDFDDDKKCDNDINGGQDSSSVSSDLQ